MDQRQLGANTSRLDSVVCLRKVCMVVLMSHWTTIYTNGLMLMINVKHHIYFTYF